MFELAVQRNFHATHAITMQGRREDTHEHDWHVSVAVTGDRLDADGLLCDFHELEASLDAVLAGLRDRDLNQTPPFDRLNPTAENVARHIAETLGPTVPPKATLSSVSVTEAPGCTATYRT